MTEDKSVLIYEFQNMVTQLEADGMPQVEKFMAGVLLEKLPPSWKDYQNNNEKKKKELAIEKTDNLYSFKRK